MACVHMRYLESFLFYGTCHVLEIRIRVYSFNRGMNSVDRSSQMEAD